MTKLMVKNNREKLSRATAEGTEKLKKEKASQFHLVVLYNKKNFSTHKHISSVA